MATTVTDSSFPLILGRDLPVHSGSVSDEDTVIAIVGNVDLVRLPISTFADGALHIQDGAPSGPSATGAAGAVAWGEGGFYTYLDGKWGLSPRVTVHWDDYSSDSRFLLVNKDQGLSAAEQEQGRKNLNVVEATETTLGLVKIKNSIADGDKGKEVPTVFAVTTFLSSYTSGLADSIGHASTTSYGTVQLASAIDSTDTGVTTGKLVYDYIEKKGVGGGSGIVEHATTSIYGTVRLASTIESSNVDIPTSGQVYSFVQDQLRNASGTVEHATTATYGTVQLATSIVSGSTAVPTSGQVADYVASKVAEVGGGNVEDATTSKKGIVQLAESMESAGDVVPTAATIKAWVESKLAGVGGGGGTGGDKISSYKGDVSIKGPNGESILVYEASSKTLTVGKGIVIKQVDTTPAVQLNTSTVAT